MTPLKELTKEQLIENYKKLVEWTVARENSREEKGQVEYQRGVDRIADYEIEMRNRGFSASDIGAEFWLTVSQMPLDGSVSS